MDKLGEAQLLRLLNYLSASDIVSLSQTCSRLRDICLLDDIWRWKCVRMNMTDGGDLAEQGGKWKKCFVGEYVMYFPYYSKFSSKECSQITLDDIVEGNPIEAAKILKRLTHFANEYHVKNGAEVKARIEDLFFKKIEQLSHTFEEAHDANDIEKIKSNYLILSALGEKKIAAQIFISKNAFFTNFSMIQQMAQDGKIENLPPIASFCEQLQSTCLQEKPIIDQVFGDESNYVYFLFVERVFAQILSEYVDILLEEAKKSSKSSYLKKLVSTYREASKLAEPLTEHIPAQQLTDLLEMTFSKYTDTYLQEELDYLTSIYESKIQQWENENQSLIEPSSPITPTTPSTPIKNLKILSLNEPSSPITPINMKSILSNLSSRLSVQLCLELIYENKDSIKRIIILSPREQTKKNIEEVFTLLLKMIGFNHIEPTMKYVINTLSQINTSETSDQYAVSDQLFDLIHIADLIEQLIDKHYEEEIIPIIPRDAPRNKCLSQKKVFEKQLDESVATCLNLIIEYMIKRADFLLQSYQNQDDFTKPVTNQSPTKACLLAIECIDSHCKKLIGCTEKSTISVLFTEIGSRFFLILSNHFKRFKITIDGGFQLLCDLDAYYDSICQFNNGKAKKLFQSLKEVGKLFIVPPEGLKQLLEEEEKRFEVEDFTMEELRTLLRTSRADYKDPKVAKIIDGAVCSIS